MIKPAIVVAAAVLGACGLAHADRVNGLTRQQLALESDQSICHQFVNSQAALAERAARNLGDCSPVTLKCRSMGYPVGSTAYLQCRQTFAAEAMAASAAAAAAPTTCTRNGNTVTCY